MTEEGRILRKFRNTPLRWYPSGKRVFTPWFKFRMFLKRIEYKIKFLIWRYK